MNLIETQNMIKPVYAPCDPLAAAVFLDPKVIEIIQFMTTLKSIVSNE